MIHCYECEFHDHDGASGYCNEFETWTNMSFSCPNGKKGVKNSDIEKSQEEAKRGQTMIDKSKVMATALHGFGVDKQRIKCIEELSELQKELCKDAIGKGSRFHIVEEIADVEIMLAQMKIHYGAEKDVEAVKTQKLRQLAEKLNIGGDEE